MPQYQIGTEGPRGVVGARAAKTDTLEAAIEECRHWSLGRGIRSAWLRDFNNGRLSDVIVTFVRGIEQ
jgi:hypothetical protein